MMYVWSVPSSMFCVMIVTGTFASGFAAFAQTATARLQRRRAASFRSMASSFWLGAVRRSAACLAAGQVPTSGSPNTWVRCRGPALMQLNHAGRFGVTRGPPGS